MVKRFLLIYTFLCIIPFLALGLIASSVTNETVTRELIHAAQVSLEETAAAMSNLGREARDFSLDIANDSTLQAQLTRYFDTNDIHARAALLGEMEAKLSSQYRRSNMTCKIYLTGSGETKPADENGYIAVIPVLPPGSWLTKAQEEPRLFFWYAAEQDDSGIVLRQVKTIYSTETWKPLPAVMAIEVHIEQLRAISLSKSYLAGHLYIVDDTGRILYPYYNYDGIPSEMLNIETGECALGDCRMIFSPVRDMPWHLIRVVDPAGIREQTRDQRRLILGIAVSLMVLSALTAVYFTQRFNRPVVKLARHMKNRRADLMPPVSVSNQIGEIRTLYESYNSMAEDLNNQIEENYISRIREREAELKALQAQINPHFLYNTLDSINWLALRYKASDISQMVVALSNMLRFSLNKGRNEILVRDELHQVDSYLILEKIQFPDRFDVTYEIEEDVRRKTMIKMLLQPLVENAIVHGFEGMEEMGHIIIRGFIKDRTIHFEVLNNGRQVDPQAMAAMLTDEAWERRTGYGIYNVNERIRIRYGKRYGLTYRVEGEWSVACITLPCEEGESRSC